MLDEDRIAAGRESLRQMLEVADLVGKRFLDIGCGSGLFSLAARQLGASVHSFDDDSESVACTSSLKERYLPKDLHWKIERGSILDKGYVTSLGAFDVVYGWGVLHHTGSMWPAMQNASELVAPGGRLFISIYNDQGPASRHWKAIKSFYNRRSRLVKKLVLLAAGAYFLARWPIGRLLRGKNPFSLKEWTSATKENRGMSAWHDVVDWVGGYPFEVARPEHVFDFFRERGFVLQRLKTCGGGHGCNEFVFERRA